MINKIIIFLASGAYTGYVPFASGTITTLIIGVPLYLLLSILQPAHYFFFLYIFFWFSCYVSHRAEVVLEEKDSSKIVVDEFVGYLVALTFLPFSWKIMIVGFALFRIFDILKVYPANLVERKVPGGLGVVLDDVVAGIYANIILHIIIDLFPLIMLER